MTNSEVEGDYAVAPVGIEQITNRGGSGGSESVAVPCINVTCCLNVEASAAMVDGEMKCYRAVASGDTLQSVLGSIVVSRVHVTIYPVEAIASGLGVDN